jgi:tetratricopeptide (TPR) repeat protein
MAPQNREYQRELAYTYSTAGNLAETQNDSALALKNYLNGLEISRAIYHADTSDFSSANDLAIDLTGTAVALEAMGNAEQAQQFLEEAVQIIQPVQSAEPANKYYMYTLAVPLIRLQRYSQAKPLISGIRETGLDDKSFQQLLRQHALD